MLKILALYAPVYVCLLWGVMLLMTREKSPQQRFLTVLMITCGLAFWVDSNYLVDYIDFRYLMVAEIEASIVVTAVPAIAIMYIRCINGRKPEALSMALLLAPVVIMGTATTLIYGIMGTENAEAYLSDVFNSGGGVKVPAEIAEKYSDPIYSARDLICRKLYYIVLGFEALMMIGYTIYELVRNGAKPKHILPFFTKNQASTPSDILGGLTLTAVGIMAIRIFLNRFYIMEHPYILGILSLAEAGVLFMIGLVGAYFSEEPVTLAMLTSPHRFSLGDDWRNTEPVFPAKEDVSTAQGDSDLEEGGSAAQRSSGAYGTLMFEFDKYFSEKHPYLDPNINIEDVAAALHSNRTYISIIVNQHHGSTFREYVNNCRVEHAKQLMKANPAMGMDEVAEQSGFLSTSQFDKKFKESEGIPPKSWRQTVG